ncbi:MAG: ABC transporter substrate-binding protein [Treponema sp.]|jgi:multiple sugar transport system substrate-binding protein|nr:ABC transporter substrate-binding protein [Treponema sp.]
MKKTMPVLAVLLLTALAFACKGKESGGGNYMRLTWWGNTVRDEQTLKVVELFKSKNPGVNIDTETTGWGGYWDKVNTQAASGSVADLMQQDYAYIGQWAGRNQLLDLTPYVQNGTVDVSKIPDSVLESGKINGKLYGVLAGTSAFCIVYDPAVLQKAGIPAIDSKTWTLKDFETVAITIYEKTGVKTLPFDPVDPINVFENLIRQTGFTLYSEDGKQLGFTGTAVLKEFWDLQLRLLDKGALVPASEAFVQGSMEEDPLSQGKSWVKYIWNTQIAAAANAAGRPLGLLFYPRIEQYRRPGTFLKPSMFFSIAAKAENPELAAKFLSFFINDLEANDIILGERGVPAPSTVRDYLTPKVDDNQKIAFAFLSQAADYSSPVAPPDPGASGEVRALFRDTTAQILNKTISSPDGVTRFMTRANQILSGN